MYANYIWCVWVNRPLVPSSFLVTITNRALVTTSDALVPSSFLLGHILAILWIRFPVTLQRGAA